MIDGIIEKIRLDTRLAKLFDEAIEYAQVYLLARQMQKGRDGKGELVTMKGGFYEK